MKKLHFLFLFLAFPFIIFSQELNRVVVDTTLNREVLIGYCNREAFSFEEIAPSFNKEYKSYHPDAHVVEYLSKMLSDYDITIVMASWCSDSKEQVPRFYTILDQAGCNTASITLIFVDRRKMAGDVDIENLRIEKVPTFIIYSTGKEAGRIIETPVESLEKDLMSIIADFEQN